MICIMRIKGVNVLGQPLREILQLFPIVDHSVIDPWGKILVSILSCIQGF